MIERDTYVEPEPQSYEDHGRIIGLPSRYLRGFGTMLIEVGPRVVVGLIEAERETLYVGAIIEAEAIGRDYGRNSASWWTQDAIGGRASARDVRPTAERVLAMIEDGDPELFDSIPQSDLSGEWADNYSARDLLAEVGLDDDDEATLDWSADIFDAYEGSYQTACLDAIERACQRVLDAPRTFYGGAYRYVDGTSGFAVADDVDALPPTIIDLIVTCQATNEDEARAQLVARYQGGSR